MSNKEKSNTDAGKPKLRPLYALAAAGILLAVGVIGAALMAETSKYTAATLPERIPPQRSP